VKPSHPQPHPDWSADESFWCHPEDLPPRPTRLPGGLHGNGRLASARHLAGLTPGPGGLSLPEATLLVEDDVDGSTLRPLLNHGLHLPAELRQRHLLAVGTTGCGKTQKLILPQLAVDLADPQRCVVALDAKGGVLFGYLCALARRHRPGQAVHLVNFKSADRTTHVWNPARHVRSRQEALEIAHAVCSNADAGSHRGHSQNDAFWLFSSINLLADTLRLLADDPREASSLARAKEVIDSGAYALALLADKHPFSKEINSRYPAVARYLEGSSNVTQQSVLADCAMRLTLFGDEEVARATSGDNELDLRALVRTGGVLVVEVPEAHARQLTPLTNLFVTRLFGALLEEAMAAPDGRLPRPCSVVLDELGSACGKLPDFETRLATMRGRGVAITGAVQSLSQLEHLYGSSAGVMEGFSTRLFFGGGLALADAKHASELAGICSVACTSRTRSRRPDGLMQHSRTTTPVARPILLPDEVARPVVHPLLGAPLTVFVPGVPPFLAYLTPAHEQPTLAVCLHEGVDLERDLADRPEPEPTTKEPAPAEDAPPPTARLSLARRVQANQIYLVQGKTQGREAWYYILVNRKPAIVFETEVRKARLDLEDYGEVLLSGWGKEPPEEAVRRAREEWGYAG
jgi:type IV secretory pathway TraG/TraD family ATPase VirD4